MDSRKFYKIEGLNKIFKFDTVTNCYDTTINGFITESAPSELSSVPPKIDGQTILFIKCTIDDNDRYVILSNEETPILRKLHPNDTIIWAKGQVYCFSDNTITDIYETTTDGILMEFSDGSTKSFPGGFLLEAGNNISILQNKINAIGYSFDANKNFIENNTHNTVDASCEHSHVEGFGNTSSISCQHVSGKYNNPDASKSFIVGWGESGDQKNIFTIDTSGTSHSAIDVTCGTITNNEPEYKLSDIHSVLSNDWEDIS